jgi:hypothetical protein
VSAVEALHRLLDLLGEDQPPMRDYLRDAVVRESLPGPDS